MKTAMNGWMQMITRGAAALMLVTSGAIGLAQADEKLPTAPYLPQSMALEAATAAWEQCVADGHRVSVAVVDRSGNLLTLIRDANAGPHTIGSSEGKAFTSASMGRPTADIAGAIADNPALAGLRDMDPRMVILGGGLPIVIDGQRVGGIGVGGAPGGHLDAICAEAGLKKIGAN